MTAARVHPQVLSVTEAARSGLPRLLRDVEAAEHIVVERRGKAVAALVSIRHLDELRRLEADLRDTALLLARAATDTGRRTDLDEVMTAFGFERSELEAEVATDVAAGSG